MSQPHHTPEERFAAIVATFRDQPHVTPPSDGPHAEKRFGAAGLKVHNKIFAMLVRGSLVVKLPRDRVDALVAAGAGGRYDPRRDGRVMREWVTIPAAAAADWPALAREALTFVASQH